MEDLSLTSFAPIIVFNILAIILFGVLMYFSSKKEKREIDKIKRESDLTIKESEFIKKESKKLLEELEIEKERNFKLKMELQLEKDSLANKPCKPKPISKPRVSKYDKPNTLYIAYDFNIRGNKSFKEILKEIKEADIEGRNKKPLCTTAIHFLEYNYLNHFENIYLVRKNGSYIDIKDFRDNPDNYSQMVSLTLSQLILEPYAKLKFTKDNKDI